MRHATLFTLIALLYSANANAAEHPLAGADERTPSRAQYFSWIDNTNEGSTAGQTLANLAFFAWLKAEYGMQLDIYAWDAGNLDTSGAYATMQDERFRQAYPQGWKPIADAAAAFGCRLGLWGGPDGFGDTPQSEQARIELMSGLCRDLHFALFKFDGVCGQLRPEKQDAFVRMMSECRKYSPDLVLLNHRLPLGKGLPYATTWLWEGAETYIDVHMANDAPATHHRAKALSRGLPPKLSRLTEDHGVCLSSCLDGWDDDLILQAFDRSLILAPEIYGSPWFLRDDEFAKLARIYNLHRRYRAIMVDGMELPADRFGPHAVSRGNATTRLVTLRNLGWEPVRYSIPLDATIGLDAKDPIEVRRLHPTERILGRFTPGQSVTIEVAPFRACLLLATTTPPDEPAVEGCDYELVRDVAGKEVQLRLLGEPGGSAEIRLRSEGWQADKGAFHAMIPDPRKSTGKIPLDLEIGKPFTIHFPGQPLALPTHRKLADMAVAPVPADAEALYEATCFAADNNALELRSLARAGATRFPAVQASRDAFLAQEWLPKRGCGDRFAFDGDPATAFRVAVGDRYRGGPAGSTSPERRLRIDLGALRQLEHLVISGAKAGDLANAEVSTDLRSWTSAAISAGHDTARIAMPATPVRFVRVEPHGCDPAEISAGGSPVDRASWRASNLFAAYASRPTVAARSATITLPEAAAGSRICIALSGRHGRDGAWAAARVNGRLVGCPDRAVSFDCNPWEYDGLVRQADRGYTYYLPVTAEMVGKPIELVVLTLQGGDDGYRAEAWITADDGQRPSLLLDLAR